VSNRSRRRAEKKVAKADRKAAKSEATSSGEAKRGKAKAAMVDGAKPVSAGKVPLQSGESVVIVARQSRLMRLPRYVVTLGTFGFWRKRNTAIVTDRRILLGKGIFSRSEQSYPMSRIDGASFTRKGLASYSEVVIETREGRRLLRVGPLSSRTARRFTSEVQSRS
jgi:Bacterial PH domain